jgi:hypothetical protein
MNFNGTNWVNVGNAGFSAGWADNISLAFNPSGQPYVAFTDFGNGTKATVMKFDGTNWVNMRDAGFSKGEAYFTTLAFSPSGQPCVVYRDDTNSQKATVMNFDGTNWMNVGAAGFSAGDADNTSLAFSLSGQLYVAYTDSWYGGEATVMKYDSVFVGIKEPQESKILLYPNPATDKITLEISGETTESNLAIVNIDDQELITCQITKPKTQIDISNLPGGVYFVRLTKDRTVAVGKIVKQ